MSSKVEQLLRGSPFSSITEAKDYLSWYKDSDSPSIFDKVKKVMASSILAADNEKLLASLRSQQDLNLEQVNPISLFQHENLTQQFFVQQLRTNPSDHLLRYAYGQWLTGYGDERGNGLKVLASLRVTAFSDIRLPQTLNTRQPLSRRQREGYRRWFFVRQSCSERLQSLNPRIAQALAAATLPDDWCGKLFTYCGEPRIWEYTAGWCGYAYTVDEIDEYAAYAFRHLPVNRRKELLTNFACGTVPVG